MTREDSFRLNRMLATVTANISAVKNQKFSNIEITGDTEEKGHSDPRDHMAEFSARDVVYILKRMDMDRHHHKGTNVPEYID